MGPQLKDDLLRIALVVFATGAVACNSHAPNPAPATRESRVMPAAGLVALSQALAQAGQPDGAGILSGKPSASPSGADLAIWYREDGDRILLTLRSSGSVLIHLDADRDGLVEPDRDVTFGAFEDGRTCVQHFHSAEQSADCAQVETAARVRLKTDGHTKTWAWSIPKIELDRTRRGVAAVSFEVFREERNQSAFYPAPPFASTYKLVFQPGTSDSAPRVAPAERPPVTLMPPAPDTRPARGTAGRPHLSAGDPSSSRPELPTVAPDPVEAIVMPVPPEQQNPQFTLLVYAGSPIASGAAIPFGDPRLKNLGFSVQYRGPQPAPGTDLLVEWLVDGKLFADYEFPATDKSYRTPHRYSNRVFSPGNFEVKLLVDGQEVDSTRFVVKEKGK